MFQKYPVRKMPGLTNIIARYDADHARRKCLPIYLNFKRYRYLLKYFKS